MTELSSSKQNLYICTYVVNPNHFYLCKKADVKNGMIKNVETKLEIYMQKNRKVFLDTNLPIQNEVVAYYYKEKKFIRCKVIGVNLNSPCYILFAMDYGFPFQINDTVNIYRITNITLKLMPSPIIKVGLTVLPTVKGFNYSTLKSTMQIHHEWTQEALETFRYDLQRSIIVNFEESFEIDDIDISFGSMTVITESGKVVNISKRLVNNDLAISPSTSAEFCKQYPKIVHTNLMEEEPMTLVKDLLLPEFETCFQNTSKELKRRRKERANRETNYEPVQNIEKTNDVLSWLQRNANQDCAPSTVDSDDLNDEEELFELYMDIEKETVEKPKVAMREKPKLSQVVPLHAPLLAPIAEKTKKVRTKDWQMTFLPGGFQIASYVSNLPKCLDEAIHSSQKEVTTDSRVSSACAANADDLEWPDD